MIFSHLTHTMTKVKAEINNPFILQFCAKIHALLFFSTDIIGFEKRTVSRECNSRYVNFDLRGTNTFQGQISYQVEAKWFFFVSSNIFAKGRPLILGGIFSKLC